MPAKALISAGRGVNRLVIRPLPVCRLVTAVIRPWTLDTAKGMLTFRGQRDVKLCVTASNRF